MCRSQLIRNFTAVKLSSNFYGSSTSLSSPNIIDWVKWENRKSAKNFCFVSSSTCWKSWAARDLRCSSFYDFIDWKWTELCLEPVIGFCLESFLINRRLKWKERETLTKGKLKKIFASSNDKERHQIEWATTKGNQQSKAFALTLNFDYQFMRKLENFSNYQAFWVESRRTHKNKLDVIRYACRLHASISGLKV